MRRGKPFEPGNKIGRGRPRGSRNKATKFAALLDEGSEAVAYKCRLMALNGDHIAMKIYMQYILRQAKPPSPGIHLPELKTQGDVREFWGTVIQQVAAGRISFDDGRAITQMLEGFLHSVQSGGNTEQGTDQNADFDYSRLSEEQLAVAEQLRVVAKKRRTKNE